MLGLRRIASRRDYTKIPAYGAGPQRVGFGSGRRIGGGETGARGPSANFPGPAGRSGPEGRSRPPVSCD